MYVVEPCAKFAETHGILKEIVAMIIISLADMLTILLSIITNNMKTASKTSKPSASTSIPEPTTPNSTEKGYPATSPVQTTPTHVVIDSLIYIPGAGHIQRLEWDEKPKNKTRHDNTVVEVKVEQSSPPPKVVGFVYKTEGTNASGERIGLEVWGQRETEMFLTGFTKAIDSGNKLFALKDTSHLAHNDGKTLVLKKCVPGDYDKHLKWVYKLQTKGPRQGQAVLGPVAFPKPVTWTENRYFLPNGTALPNPETWSSRTTLVDEHSINLDDLFEVSDDVEAIVSPVKKQKTDA